MTTTPDPRQLSPDPRLSSPATYSREVAISSIISLYQSIPHIDPADIQFPPHGGWPEITTASLAERGLHKTDEVVELLQNIPFIAGIRPWVAPDSFALDYRRVLKEKGRAAVFVWELAGYDDSESVPPWVVQITTGTDQMLAAYMLDTSDGTFTRYMQIVVYPEPTSLYSTDDPRCWRNVCDDQTWPVEQLVQEWQAKYRSLEWLGLPGNMKWPSVLVYDGEPNGWLSKECIKMQEIYREHGWPHNYRGGECRAAVQSYWDNRHNTAHAPPPTL
ncbi:hypothetical protein VE01_07051 [Pseudogymnoascus verrucosus]|uniref:Uncharacterized protein n=1 Tax=Pseudogymnoascus verrucosus TaxID=342668 RepID=A0A1B8GE77_9PEZI|nr:uncharacterized protein VE01_07051 [Pseudogymnoascus verrucosus]OBT94131.2 hypothetical protein VE01_07051 [Pseudogymnoascus verrucosus]